MLISGGIDSSILCVDLLNEYSRVYPLYVRSGLRWENVELDRLRAFLKWSSHSHPGVEPLTILDEPVGQVYGEHWSTESRIAVPGSETSDEAVYLPGRNILLAAKAAVWCRLRNVETLAFGTLKGNPFPDSTPEFFSDYTSVLNRGLKGRLRIVRPYEQLSKIQVLERGAGLPLHLTFSCLDPVEGHHCGLCNKCQERRNAFLQLGWPDNTDYAADVAVLLQAEPHECTE